MANKDGRIEAIFRKRGYKTWMGGRESIADEPYFSYLKDGNNSDALYVGWHPSRLQHHDGFVVMSRPVIGLDGAFNGAVLIAVNSDYVLNFFNAVTADRNSKLVLMRDNQHWDQHKLLVNQLGEGNALNILETIMQRQRVSDMDDGVMTVVYENNSHKYSVTDHLQLYSFDHIPYLHMIVSVVIPGEDIFATWSTERLSDLVFLAIFALFVLVVSFFALAVAKLMQRVQRSEQAAVMASQAKSDFLASMSHELRTPLNAIIGFSEMMEAGYFGKLNPKQKERIHDINYCGNHLLELINDILEFSKGEAGKIELHEEKVSMSKLIKDTVRIFSERSRKEGVEITYEVHDAMPQVYADGRKIKQILLNLLSNAVKFTEEHGTVEVTCHMEENGALGFTVTDTGIGMAEEDIPKALSAFGQVHHEVGMNKDSPGGTGLGLPLCKMFAELHGGKLILQSIEGVGTKVTVLLPAERVIVSPTGLPPISTPKPTIRPTGHTASHEVDKNTEILEHDTVKS